MKTLCKLMLVLLMTTILSCLTSDSGNDDKDSVTTYTLSGKVIDNSGSGISGASVTLTGDNQPLTVTTGSNGGFIIRDIENGSYTITPTKSGYTFTPANRQAVVNGSNVAVENFNGYSGEGSLAPHDGPNTSLTEDNIVEVNQLILETVNSIIERCSESLKKPSVPSELSTRVDGDASGYAIISGGRGFGKNAFTQDYTCTLFDFSDDGELFLGGLVHYQSTTQMETFEEIKTYSGDVSLAGTYAVSESFEIEMKNGVETNGTYEAASAGNTFHGSFNADDFEEDTTYDIFGRIYDSSGNALSDVTVELINTGLVSVTDKEGIFYFGNIANGAYRVSPGMEGYTFSPVDRQIIVDGSNVIVDDFIGYTGGEGEYAISGRIVDSSGAGIAGMKVYLTREGDGQFAETYDTDENGNFSFENLINGTYTLRLVHGLFSFSPDSIQATVENSNLILDTIVGSSEGEDETHNVYGSVYDSSGERLADVTLILVGTDMFSVADKEGNYFFSGLSDGTYTVAPQLEGYTFTPQYRNITVSGADVLVDDFTGSTEEESIHNVLGRILDSSGEGIADVLVSVNDGAYTGYTDKEGNYFISGVPDGRHTVVPSLEGYTFSPDDRHVTMHGEDETVDTFTGTPEAGGDDGVYTISGRVVDSSGNGIADVMIGTRTTEGTVLTQTDSNGNYSFENLPAGSYMLVPEKEGYTFSPDYLLITVSSSNVTAGGFTGAPEGGENKHSIYGLVADSQGNLLADVTVTLSGTDRTTQTDKEGNYFFGNVDDGAYTVIPSLAGYTFMPQSRTVTVAGSDIFVEPFLGTAEGGGTGDGDYTVSGVVTDSGGTGIEGVTITLGGEEDDLTTRTGSEGTFEFKNVSDGDYVVYPTLIGMAFTPPAQPVTVRGSDVTANFTQLSTGGDDDTPFTIAGKILDADGNGISDVSLTLTGATGTRQAVTNSAGDYVIANVKSESYILLPMKEGYTFSPMFMQVTPTAGDMEINFTGYPEGTGGDSFSVLGRIVTESGKGIPDVAVELKSVALDGTVVGIAFTDEDGRYYFEDIFTGEFTVTPSLEGYSFDPQAQTISISDRNASVEDFIGTGGDGDGEVYESTASALISTGGGSLSVRNHRGDVITLEFPPRSILDSEVITLTTLTEQPGNPIADNIFPGVSIEPDGLILNAPVKLSVTLAEPPADIDQCTVFWSVYDDYIIPIGSQEYLYDTIEGDIYHFSVYSAGKATQEEVSSQITKIATIGIPFEKAAAHASSNYGWQGSYTSINGLLHWAEISAMHGHDEAAEKAIEEAKKIAEEDAETFVDEVIPPVDPCKDKDYQHTLDKYLTSLMMLGSEGSSVYNKVYNQYEQIADRCTVHATLDITYDQKITMEDGDDSFEYQGTVTIYLPIYGLEGDEEFGVIKGGGTMLLTGSGRSKDCTWTKAGNIDVTASGNLEADNDPGSLTPELNLTLTEIWDYTQTTTCDNSSWSQDISLSPEPSTFKVPYVDGHTIDKTLTFQNTVIHIKYVFHFPEND